MTDPDPSAEPRTPPPGPATPGRPVDDDILPDLVLVPSPAEAPVSPVPGPFVWGVVGLRAFAFGEQVAPNGLEFNPLFALDLNFNLWLYRPARVYGFSDTHFWGQRAAPGITNPSQGGFDFSKREFDINAGVAWNYYRYLEARVFAYSFNNLNRGTSSNIPIGYADGVGLENRLYLSPVYGALGTPAFDVARATFLSVGYYPTKDLVDGLGRHFKPGPFARAYLTWNLLGDWCYLFADVQGIARRSFTPKLGQIDAGLAVRPFVAVPRLEFRLGTADTYDMQFHDLETGLYGAVRFIY